MKRLLKSKKGAALAVVLIVFSVVAIVGTTVLSVSLSQTSLSKSTEDMTSAYYYARSAVEIISSRINKAYEDVEAAEPSYPEDYTPTVEEAQADLALYQAAQAAFDALMLVPTEAAPHRSATVRIDGYGDLLVSVDRVINSEGDPENIVSCAVTHNGKSSSARAKIGSFDTVSAEIIYTVLSTEFPWLGDHAIFSYDDIYLDNGTNFTMKGGGEFTAVGDLTDGGITYKTEAGNANLADDVNEGPSYAQDMPIIVPTADMLTTVHTGNIPSGQNKNNPHVISSSQSGYYPDFNEGDGIYWEVDTSGGDVVLIFDDFTVSGGDIVVSGSGSLYIFVVEPVNSVSSNTLISLSGNFGISNKSGNKKPQTFIAVYNNILQTYRENHDDESGDPASVIPKGEIVNGLPVDVAAGKTLDTVLVDNKSAMSAYIYAPTCGIYANNNTDIYGSFYGSHVYIKNNKSFTYYPFTASELTDEAEPIKTTATTSTVYPAYDASYDRIWLR